MAVMQGVNVLEVMSPVDSARTCSMARLYWMSAQARYDEKTSSTVLLRWATNTGFGSDSVLIRPLLGYGLTGGVVLASMFTCGLCLLMPTWAFGVKASSPAAKQPP